MLPRLNLRRVRGLGFCFRLVRVRFLVLVLVVAIVVVVVVVVVIAAAEQQQWWSYGWFSCGLELRSCSIEGLYCLDASTGLGLRLWTSRDSLCMQQFCFDLRSPLRS